MAKYKTIYVITSGCYSDYGINAMFSTRKLAEKYIADAKDAKNSSNYNDDTYVSSVYFSDDANIEEWLLDEESKAKVFSYWNVVMMLDDGSVVENHTGREFGHPQSKIEQCGDKIPCYQMRPIVRVRSVKSANHAMKLAVEARQKWLREKTEKGK
jgi:hypothetical protein